MIDIIKNKVYFFCADRFEADAAAASLAPKLPKPSCSASTCDDVERGAGVRIGSQ